MSSSSASRGLIFSGIQPTGNLHLGNYLGAIRNWVQLQDEFDCLFCVVDLHAVTVEQEPAELRRATVELAAGLIAAGIDPDKNILFNQALNPNHAELAWLFNCVARIGWLNRMTQFKEKAGKHRENATVGLYDYPVLMAADILAYRATHVPVGEDQKQHLELTRDIAQAFNSQFGVDLFPLPEPQIFGAATRVMSLRDGTKKMSKSDISDFSRINMTDGPDDVALKIRKAKTDPEPIPETVAELAERPEAKNLIGIMAALTGKTAQEVTTAFAGKGFGDFKKALTEVAVEVLGGIGAEYQKLMADPAHVEAVLAKGGEKARALSAPVLQQAYDAMGFLGVKRPV